MTVPDMLRISIGNMWRMKLRASLTVAGVMIAIAAFVSMLSFGAGNQQNIERQYNDLGLFTTMFVYPKDKSKSVDTVEYPKLDKHALSRFAKIPGVNLVYPYDAFSIQVKYGDSIIASRAQSISFEAIRTKLYSRINVGTAFESDSSKQIIISSEMVKQLGITVPDSIIGKKVVAYVYVSQVDSGLAHIIMDNGESLLDRIKKIHFDSLLNREYRAKVIRTETNSLIRRFINGFMNAQEKLTDTLTVCGVRDVVHGGRMKIEPVIIPIATAERFRSSGFSQNPLEMFNSLSSGTFLTEPDNINNSSYSQVTLNLDLHIPYQGIKDTLEKLGYKTFSFAEQFKEIQKFFFYFDIGLGIIGLIALVTASLGIMNTMVMSIIERKREIGILKSLGAYERDIGILFLFESGMIGMIGTTLGILMGWTITRIISMIAQSYMRDQGIPDMELFALPYWLILISLAVGVGVSILAGFYPAARASRVDPVEALRND
ncbi:MAG: ABC transporter permease [Ignavibacteriales bacterium]|nr:ABC transporter permease [Ignavibacteriales bacterium]